MNYLLDGKPVFNKYLRGMLLHKLHQKSQLNTASGYPIAIHATKKIGLLQLKVTWYKIRHSGMQKDVPESKIKHN